MRRSLRDVVRVRYDYRCGYCGVSETHIGAKMTVDHFLPRSLGGDDSLDNLVYCCPACNEFKGEYWYTDDSLRLQNPLFDDTAAYFFNRIKILQLNRDELFAHRREQQDIAAVRAQCKTLEEYIAGLEQTEEANAAEIGVIFGDADA